MVPQAGDEIEVMYLRFSGRIDGTTWFDLWVAAIRLFTLLLPTNPVSNGPLRRVAFTISATDIGSLPIRGFLSGDVESSIDRPYTDPSRGVVAQAQCQDYGPGIWTPSRESDSIRVTWMSLYIS